MSAISTRRRLVLGAAALPLGASVTSLFIPKVALACHDYVSGVDGARGCTPFKRDRSSGSSGSTSSSPSSSPSTGQASQPQSSSTASSPSPSSGSGLVYQDELVGFGRSRKSGQRARLSEGTAPDGKRALRAEYVKGRSACGATTFLDLFPGNGVSRAVFDVDLWISQGFGDIPGKLFGAYGGGDAWGGQVAGKTGCRVEGGWASRITHGRLDRVDLYSYHQNRDTDCYSNGKQFGKTFVSKGKLITGRWVTFRQEIVMNTPGSSNGVVRLWMNGSKLMDIGGLMYQRQSDRYGIKGWSVWSALGGSCNSSSLYSKSTMNVWYRNLRVST